MFQLAVQQLCCAWAVTALRGAMMAFAADDDELAYGMGDVFAEDDDELAAPAHGGDAALFSL